MPNSLTEVLPRQGLSICQMTIFIKMDCLLLIPFSQSNSYLYYTILKHWAPLQEIAQTFSGGISESFTKTLRKSYRNRTIKEETSELCHSIHFTVLLTEAFVYHFSGITGSRLNCSHLTKIVTVLVASS